MISKSIVTEQDDDIVIHRLDGQDNVHLSVLYADKREMYSYVFTIDDFRDLAKMVESVAVEL